MPSSTQFWIKLQISCDDDRLTNAGSLVHYNTQTYKTTTGYWMDNLEPGYYTLNSPLAYQYQLTQIIKMQYCK